MRALMIGLVLVAACGSDTGGAAGRATSTPRADSGAATLRGTLGGDGQLEGGCAWLDDGDTRWEVVWPEGYRVSFDPLTLTGPEGDTATEGDTVTVEGSEQADAMTICQVGPVWRATAVRLE